MTFFTKTWPGLIALFVLLSGQAGTASPAQTETQTNRETAKDAAEPIPTTQVPAQVERTRELLRNLAERRDADSILPQSETALAGIKSRISVLREETESAIDGKAWWKVLEDLQRNWLSESTRIQQWLRRLDYHIQELDGDLATLDQQLRRWKATEVVESAQPGGVMASRVSSSRESLQREIDRLSRLQSDLLAVQDQLIDLLAACDRSQEALESASRTSLLGFDSPPLWTALLHPARAGKSPFDLQFERLQSAFHYVSTEDHRIAAQGLLLLALMVPAWLIAGKIRRGELPGDHPARILLRPFSSALLVTLVVTRFFHPGAPRLVYTAAGLLLLIPLLRVVPQAVGRFRPQIYVLSVLYLLGILVDFAVENTLFGRLLLLGIAALSLLVFSLVVGQVRTAIESEGEWGRFLTILARIVQGLLLFSLLVNTLGSVSLSGLVIDATLKAVYGGILLWAGFTVLNQGLSVVLGSSAAAARLRIVQAHRDRLVSGGGRLLAWTVTALWVYYALSAFRLQAFVWRTVVEALTTPIKIGELAFSLGDLLSFVAVIWLAFLISRLLRFFLEEEAMPRFSLPQGVPATISRLTHYTVLLFGFLIAITAAGLGLDRITLLTGAFGVGIGFGLQNIVNNLVSGLILLFERPLKIGDQIQIDDFVGKVTSIGFRSSVIRTFEGAEMIVPNGNLISETVINWTLSDQLRRAEINVGVAYGTDPRRVLDLLVEVAKQHPDIISEPPPIAVFHGFGESSLDFSLRAWTNTVDRFITIRSELTVSVNAALVEAGIEIPFPQRDLHFRDGAPKPVSVLVGEPKAEVAPRDQEPK